MIRRLQILCSVLAAWLLFTGCEPATHIPKDALVVGQTAEPNSLDPHTTTSSNDFRITENIYEGLVRFAPGTLTIEPALATSWDISDDGRTYTFHLREDVRFHDGSPFNAEAVVFNLQRILRDDHPFHHTGPFPLASFFSTIASVEASDGHTVRIQLNEPFSPLLSNLAYPTGLIVSPAAVREHGREFARHPSGTGPYRFAEWQPQRFVRLTRFEDYYGEPANLENIYFRPLNDPNARLTELLAGGIDIALEIPPDVISFLRAKPGYRVVETVGPHLWFLILNCREAPFDDPRIRRAVNYAVNKQAIVDHLLQGTASVAAGPIPAAFEWASNPDVKPYPHDPDKARHLLKEAGYDGQPLTLYAAQSGSGMLEPVTMAIAIQADLAAVGMTARIQTFEWNTYLAKVNDGLAGQAHMAEMAWMTNDPDTLPFLALHSCAQPQDGGFNSGYYANEQLDQLLEQARSATSRNERARLYQRIQRIAHEDAPWLFVASWKQNAVCADTVRDFQLEPSFLLRLNNVTKTAD